MCNIQGLMFDKNGSTSFNCQALSTDTVRIDLVVTFAQAEVGKTVYGQIGLRLPNGQINTVDSANITVTSAGTRDIYISFTNPIPVGTYTLLSAGVYDTTTGAQYCAVNTATGMCTTLTVTNPPTTGSISCTTTPTGASVYLDGNLQTGLTPVTLTNISAGSHSVKFTKSGYNDCMKSVTVIANSTVSADCTLTAVTAAGNISCTTVPTGASVYLDGNLTGGLTPVTLTNISAGSHQVKFTKSGYNDCMKSVTVIANSTVSAGCTLTVVTTQPTTTSAPSSKAPIIIGALVVVALGIVVLKKKRII